MPFVSQRNVSSRETVIKLSHCQSSDDSSWTELTTREVTFDDLKVSPHMSGYWLNMEAK